MRLARRIIHNPRLIGDIRPAIIKCAPPKLWEPEKLARLVNSFSTTLANSDQFSQDGFWSQEIPHLNRSFSLTIRQNSLRETESFLRSPKDNELFYGFDNLHKRDHKKIVLNEYLPKKLAKTLVIFSWWPNWLAALTYDALHQLCSFIGLIKLDNPEATTLNQKSIYTVDTLVACLEQYFGAPLSFPNIYDGEIGIKSSKGVITYRAVLALYYVSLIHKTLGSIKNKRIIEIGAGRGWTAYFASILGAKAYKLVDLSLAGICQAYFLTEVLGKEEVSWNEEIERKKIHICHPEEWNDDANQYDLIVNFDSITEMPEKTALSYIQGAVKVKVPFLSVNHEANLFRFSEIVQKINPSLTISRHVSPVRKGYVEELVSG